LELIGVFPQVVQQSGGVALLFGTEGGGKPTGLLSHATQVVTEKLGNARTVGIGAVPEKRIAVDRFLTGLHRFLLVAFEFSSQPSASALSTLNTQLSAPPSQVPASFVSFVPFCGQHLPFPIFLSLPV
jgi:hypothetical protein